MRRRLFGCAVLLACAGGAALATTSRVVLDDEFHQSYALSAHGRVALENLNGDVHIAAWNRNEVRVDAVKRASSPERLDSARIIVDSRPDAISIKTAYNDLHHDSQPASVEYRVRVPKSARLDAVTLVNGTLEINGVTGDVKASAVNGLVRAEGLAGDTKISTVNGRLEASFERLDQARSITLNSINGSIAILIPFDARAELDASNVTGGIRNDFGLPVDRGRFVGSRLAGVLKGGGTRIRLHNVNGEISIVPMAHGRRVRFT